MPANHRVRIFILSDVRLYREGLAQALSQYSDLQVIGAAPVNRAGVRWVAAERPDIVLAEAAPSIMAVLAEIRAGAPEVRVMAYGVAGEDQDALQYAEGGAAGFVSQDATLEELVATILSVAQGEFPCSPRITALMLQKIASLAAERRTSNAGLTLREGDILRLIDEGFSNKDIARRLGIRLSTVKNHVHHILEKLQASGRGQAAARARRLDLERQQSRMILRV
jgi:two-component system nitrate/nitrite response regulator NarL